jgi:hypothetical protein
MAKALNVPESALRQVSAVETGDSLPPHQGLFVDQVVLERFHQLGPYLEMLNRAVSIKDEELIEHIAGKLSDLFAFDSQLKAVNN